MRRLVILGWLALTGCSTAPVAGLLDCVAPAKHDRGADQPRGLEAPDVLPRPPRDLGPRSVDPLPPPTGLSDPVPPASRGF
jgi:hypothetical protein